MNETKKLIVTIIGFGVVICALLGWLYTQMATVGWEPFKNEDSIATKIEKLDMAIAAAQARIDQIPDARNRLTQLKRDQESAVQLLPKENDPAQLLYFITAKAQEVDVKIEDIKPSKGGDARRRRAAVGSAEDKFEKWQYDMKLAGTYDNLATFVNKMEEFEITTLEGTREKRFFSVEELLITSEKNGMIEGKAQHTAQLRMVTYRYTAGDDGEQPVRRR